MKSATYIAPAIALILVGSWVGSQRGSIAAVEAECVRLRTTIAAAKSSSDATPTPHDPLEQRRKVIQWTKLAERFSMNPMGSGMVNFGALPDPRMAMHFMQRMDAMSADEIIITLDEIAALDLPTNARATLEWTLLDALIQKDPSMVLDRISHRIGGEDYRISGLYSGALQTWAIKDPAAAGAWFDQQIAAGKFKGKLFNVVNDDRRAIETGLIKILLGNSPEAATRRLAALPEKQRGTS